MIFSSGRWGGWTGRRGWGGEDGNWEGGNGKGEMRGWQRGGGEEGQDGQDEGGFYRDMMECLGGHRQ